MAKNHNKLDKLGWAKKTGAALMAGIVLSGCTPDAANNGEAPKTVPAATAEAKPSQAEKQVDQEVQEEKVLILTPDQMARVSEIAGQTVINRINAVKMPGSRGEKPDVSSGNASLHVSRIDREVVEAESYDTIAKGYHVDVYPTQTIDGLELEIRDEWSRSCLAGKEEVVCNGGSNEVTSYLRFLSPDAEVIADGRLDEGEIRQILLAKDTRFVGGNLTNRQREDKSGAKDSYDIISVEVAPDGTVSASSGQDPTETLEKIIN